MLRAYAVGLFVVVVAVVVNGCGDGEIVSHPSASQEGGSAVIPDVSYLAETAESDSYSRPVPAVPNAADPNVAAPDRALPTVNAAPAGRPAPGNDLATHRRSRLAEDVPAGVERREAIRSASTVPLGEVAGLSDNLAVVEQARDRFDQIVENEFLSVRESPLSTFSIDVDTASYAKTRMYLQQRNELPPPDAVRIEELVNYFDYQYTPPVGDDPFAVHMEVARAPWRPEHLLARVGIKGREVEQRPACNLVFLIDVSGSMNRPNKLGLVKQGLQLLTTQLNDDDRVAIVVYAGAAGLVLPPTHGDNRHVIMDAVARLSAGGSTNGAQGIRLAYNVARQNFVPGGVNRVLLCTDGDFNVGTTNTGDLVRLAAGNAREGVFLSVLGFGMGNHNDAMLETLSNQANGNYAFIDSDREARKVLLDQLDSTLVTIAKDVKIQIEFNPAHVTSYRLIGYENRRLEDRDFNDDTKDAGEIGAGHTVTALYELVLADGRDDSIEPLVDPLKYQSARQLAKAADSDDLLNLKLRFKRPHNDHSELAVFPIKNTPLEFGQATQDFQFAAAVAEFGMLLRNSQHRGGASYGEVLEIAGASRGRDPHGYRTEFLQVVSAARRLVEPEAAAMSPALPVIAYRGPVKVGGVGYHQPSPQIPVRFLVAIAIAGWLIISTIGLVVIAWAILGRHQDQAWHGTTVPAAKTLH